MLFAAFQARPALFRIAAIVLVSLAFAGCKKEQAGDVADAGADAATTEAAAAQPAVADKVTAMTPEQLRALVLGPGAEAADGAFTARARQVEALVRAAGELEAAARFVRDGSLDLAAEALRVGHDALGEVTGQVLPDALLGHIFSTFCIGK